MQGSSTRSTREFWGDLPRSRQYGLEITRILLPLTLASLFVLLCLLGRSSASQTPWDSRTTGRLSRCVHEHQCLEWGGVGLVVVAVTGGAWGGN